MKRKIYSDILIFKYGYDTDHYNKFLAIGEFIRYDYKKLQLLISFYAKYHLGNVVDSTLEDINEKYCSRIFKAYCLDYYLKQFKDIVKKELLFIWEKLRTFTF